MIVLASAISPVRIISRARRKGSSTISMSSPSSSSPPPSWVRVDGPDPIELRRRLLEPGQQTPVLISYDDYMRTAEAVKNAGIGSDATTPLVGFSADQGLVLLLPGPYAACAAEAARAGATPVGFRTYWGPS